MPINAFLFAVEALLLVRLLVQIRGGRPETSVPFGVGIGLTATALLSLIQYMASADTRQSQYIG